MLLDGPETLYESLVSRVPPHSLFARVSFIVACLIGGLLTAVFIKKKIEAEEALRESEDKYHSIFDSVTDALLVIDYDGIIVEANPQACRMYGYSQEEMIGLPGINAVHPDYYYAFRELKKSAREQGEFDAEGVHLRKDGSPFSIEVRGGSFLHKGEQHLLVVVRDISERKQAEEALQGERELLLSIFESIPQIIYVSDPITYEILYVNDTLKKAFKKDPVGDLCYKEFQGLEAPCEFCTNEIILKEKYNSYQWEYDSPILNRVFMVTDRIIKWPDDRDVRFEIAIDITERKRAEEALREANKELLKEHNQRKILSKRLIDLLEKDRRQIGMELHDHIGQTLTSLKLNLETIHAHLEPTESELRSQIKAAKEKAIGALKDVKSISHGLKPSVLDALGLESSLRELFNETQQEMDVEIHFFSRGIPKRFEGEKELAMYRIAQEALTNIIRHAQAENVFVNLVKKEEKFSLSVEDDGIGFNPSEVRRTTWKKGPLGFIIMQERAVQLNGELTLESLPGKGTHVLLDIPV